MANGRFGSTVICLRTVGGCDQTSTWFVGQMTCRDARMLLWTEWEDNIYLVDDSSGQYRPYYPYFNALPQKESMIEQALGIEF